MITADRLLREVETMRTESALGALRNPNLEVSLEFGYGVAHGRDQGFEMVLIKIHEMLTAEEDEEKE